MVDESGCGVEGIGSAIYVVDLQTGQLLRRFVEYDASGGTFSRLLGSPALYDSFTGSVATRGFVGDSKGRLFRMKFTDPDPSAWTVDLFFDPAADASIQAAADSAVAGGGTAEFGPAAYRPSISRGPEKQLVVSYGLGEPGDTTTADQAQIMITLAENPMVAGGVELIWYLVFEEGEKLTGQPVVFNSGVYFPTYAVPSADVCEPGSARIYGLRFYDVDPSSTPLGLFDGVVLDTDPDLDADTANNWWFGPSEPTLIRGLTITMGPQCNVRGLGDSLDTADMEGADATPQLIAQTSGVSAGSLDESRGVGATPQDVIGRLVKDLPRPRSMTIPLSWSVVSN